MASWFSKVWAFLKGLVVRSGLDVFLSKYLGVAEGLLLDLAKVNGGASFHIWKQKAFEELKRITGEARDNWISIVLALALEKLKAERKM
jgi:hypothetical protein